MTIRAWLIALMVLPLATKFSLTARELPVAWGDNTWQLQIDPASGALVRIENKNDPQHMDWLREPGRWNGRDWIADSSTNAVTLDGQWGLVETTQAGLLHAGQLRKVSDQAWEIVYTSSTLTVTAWRELDTNGELIETYTFKNTGNIALDLPLGSIAITAPLFDQYADANISLAARCHVHLWMGGSSAWINAQRMGTEPPHLGLVLTRGSLNAYSQRCGTFNDRGVLLLHPAAMKLDPNKSATVAWKLFWHQGWEDFFSKLGTTTNFVRLTAKNYTVTVGQPLEITAESASALDTSQLFANGQPIAVRVEKNRLTASIPTTTCSEVLVELRNKSQRAWLRANITPPVDDLIEARVKFIVRKQQRNAAGNPLDGAYLSYDNETDQQIYDSKWPDHNAGRERVAMGTLGALYLPICKDETFKVELKESLLRYAAFEERELEDNNGVVYSSVGRKDSARLYNYPWVAHFHLAMYRATDDAKQLDRYVRVMRSYYAKGGVKEYCIGIPIADGLNALQSAGRTNDYAQLLADFKNHAAQIIQTGLAYPRHEVNFEQFIVAPGVQILAELYAVTGERIYLDGAKLQMPVLEAFCGKQPDFRLNEVAIRHWDDYWFGKMKTYGDTLPHYWSTLNGVAYAWYGRATGDTNWFQRADGVVKANLALFNPDGSATCAHLYPLTIDRQPTAKDDPWANDQDWALVNLFSVRAIKNPKRP